MKIRRRGHPIDPRKSNPGSNADGFRMRRTSPDLYNHNGDPIDRDAIQAEVERATTANRAVAA